MKNPDNTKLVKDWLAFATENLLFAKSGMKEEFAPYHSICYMCQSSAEKFLKAFLLQNGWKLKKSHDLSELLGFCCEYDKSYEVLYEYCEILNDYIIEGRYPTDLPFESITQQDALDAINAAVKIETMITSKIIY